jgi:hypothetical protein
MTLGVDGLYHELEGMKYCCLGEKDNYTYEQIVVEE